MANQLISIIIPIYNAEQTLDGCIESAAIQTYREIEIVLVDDGSTDKSLDICTKWAKQDGRIKIIHKKNGGVSSARNMGIELSQGIFVLMLDSDDRLMPDACEVLINHQKTECTDCIVFGYIGDRTIAPKKELRYGTLEEFRLDFSKWLNTDLMAPAWNKCYRRATINSRFNDSISFGEDLVFVLSYFKQCRQILFIPNVLYQYDTSNLNSLSRSAREEKIYDIEYWQIAILEFANRKRDKGDVYKKYMDDALNYVRELYCNNSLSYRKKIQILKQWYPQSHMKKANCRYRGSWFYRILWICVQNEWWIAPQILLWSVRSFKRLKQTLRLGTLQDL